MQEAASAMQSAAQDAKSQSQAAKRPVAPAAQFPIVAAKSAIPAENSRNPQSAISTSQSDAKTQEEDAKKLEQALAEAEKRAEEVLEALRKMEQNATQNLDQLQALTLAERLRKVGDQEKDLCGQLTTNLADTVGLPPQELPEKFKLLNTFFVRHQGGARDESAALQAEISRFFERTQKPNYGKVSQDMKDSHTPMSWTGWAA
jgi:hypothetical protein